MSVYFSEITFQDYWQTRIKYCGQISLLKFLILLLQQGLANRKTLHILTSLISILSSQRRTSGPSSVSPRWIAILAMSTAAASWSYPADICCVFTDASTQLCAQNHQINGHYFHFVYNELPPNLIIRCRKH